MAGRSDVALCLVANDNYAVLRSFVDLWAVGRVLAPLLLVGAALWQPPAAKEG